MTAAIVGACLLASLVGFGAQLRHQMRSKAAEWERWSENRRWAEPPLDLEARDWLFAVVVAVLWPIGLALLGVRLFARMVRPKDLRMAQLRRDTAILEGTDLAVPTAKKKRDYRTFSDGHWKCRICGAGGAWEDEVPHHMQKHGLRCEEVG